MGCAVVTHLNRVTVYAGIQGVGAFHQHFHVIVHIVVDDQLVDALDPAVHDVMTQRVGFQQDAELYILVGTAKDRRVVARQEVGVILCGRFARVTWRR